MPAASTLLDKLRELITHDGTPAAERSAALERLERLIGGHDGPSVIATRITRSTRIGRQRRAVVVDELGRLDRYTCELSVAECIAHIARASAPSGLMPMQIDFGTYSTDQPVIAVRFPAELAPRVVDFSAAIETVLPGSRVNLADRAGPGERLFLVYPKGQVVGAERAA
jgi:hypothetical protein